VVPSQIGSTIRSARERAGWSREALAYHSGLSWAAIAQIESGRRQDVRLASVVAIANALAVSVDYLVNGPTSLPPQLLKHEAVVYASAEEYTEFTVPFLLEGLTRSEAVLAVTAKPQMGWLREALGDDASRLEFKDSEEWYRAPVTTLNAYRAFIDDKLHAGARWIRILGDPVWDGRSAVEVAEWTRFESMINLSLGSSPVRVICPYDARAVSKRILEGTYRTHPEVVEGGDAHVSPTYREPEEFLLTAR
jgi:transcriptional regulator with XRE-family HTH domain